MPYSRPTLTELRRQVAADIAANLSGADALLRFSNLNITGTAQAGLSHLHYGYLDWISRQAVPYTATGEFLEAWGALKKVYRKAATNSRGKFAATGTPGTTLSAGLGLVAGDGTPFQTIASADAEANGSVWVWAAASEPGASGNISAGVTLSLATALPGINAAGVAASDFTGGADQEQDEPFRARVIAAYQRPPQGGSKDDYVGWATEVAGITRAWCAPNGFGVGTVVVYIMLDIAQAANDGFPVGTDGISSMDTLPNGHPRDIVAVGDQLIAANAIYSMQPVTALVYWVSPRRNRLTFTVSGLANASAATKAAIHDAVSDVLTTQGDPRAGTIDLLDILTAIAAVPGTAGLVVTSIVGVQGEQSTTYDGNITSLFGYLPVVHDILYV